MEYKYLDRWLISLINKLKEITKSRKQMGYSFGKKSQKNLDSCHPDIQKILNRLIQYYDFSVIEGYRSQERQQELFSQGKSTLDGVETKSKHQVYPSMAVDIIPYKKDHNPWEDSQDNLKRYYFMMGMVKSLALEMYINGEVEHSVRFGLDWQMDDVYNTKFEFTDCPHMELI